MEHELHRFIRPGIVILFLFLLLGGGFEEVPGDAIPEQAQAAGNRSLVVIGEDLRLDAQQHAVPRCRLARFNQAPEDDEEPGQRSDQPVARACHSTFRVRGKAVGTHRFGSGGKRGAGA